MKGVLGFGTSFLICNEGRGSSLVCLTLNLENKPNHSIKVVEEAAGALYDLEVVEVGSGNLG